MNENYFKNHDKWLNSDTVFTKVAFDSISIFLYGSVKIENAQLLEVKNKMQ